MELSTCEKPLPNTQAPVIPVMVHWGEMDEGERREIEPPPELAVLPVEPTLHTPTYLEGREQMRSERTPAGLTPYIVPQLLLLCHAGGLG